MKPSHLTPEQAFALLQSRSDITIIDVRTDEEFEMFLIAGAQNYDISESDFEDRIDSLDRSGHYLVHCHTGQRSNEAVKVFTQKGFQNIYHLIGGLREWAYLDLPHIYNHSL